MKNKLMARLAILILALSGTLSIGALAQTTDEGPGPSEQPSAPMEVGQDQSGQDQSYDAGQSDAQPTDAQPGGPSGEAPAQTDQGVARVSLMHGDVSTQRGDSGDWSAAVLNQPVMTGDKVSTGDSARTELQLDFANILRLGPNTQANIANLTRKNIQIQLSHGIADFVVSKDSESEPEVNTPNVSVHPSHHDGVFRIEVRPDGDTVVIVRKGEAQIATPQGSTEVRSGEMATVRGDSDSAQYKISSAPDRDDWDRWNSDRDHLIRNANSWRHTNRYYTGAEDLDAYGRWQNVPDYGDVWVPNEPDGWVPYRNGNWVWEPAYGWTWVGYEPWGWAPYHYGRWFPYGASWAWWPGPVYGGGFYRPFWAPAYVSFWGWGGGWGFGFGFGGWGGFGWLPVGPCDWFHPWWGGYRGRFGVVNVTNIHITNINRFGGIAPLHGGNRFSNVNNLRNDHVFRAMSTMNAGHFGTTLARPTPVTRQQLNGARMMAGNLPVVPTRASLSASGRAAAPSTVRNGGSQRFFGTSHSNVARPVSFQQQQASLRQTMQQNRVGGVPAGGRFNSGTSTGSRGITANSNLQRPSAGTLSTRQMNNPGNRSVGNQPSTVQNGSRGGFRPFNPPASSNRSAGTPSVQSPRGTASRPVNRGDFRPFTPPSNTRSASPANQGQRGVSQSMPAQNRDGFRPFTPPNNNTRSSGAVNMGSARGDPQRGMSQSAPGGFRPFSPPSSNEVSRGRSSAPSVRGNSGGYWNRTAPSAAPRGNSSTYWNRTAPSAAPPRNYGSPSGSYGRGSSSRPQLDMRQPIVRGPSYSGPSRGSSGNYGGYRAAPSYGGSRGPSSYGGSHAAPSYGGGGRSYGGGGGHLPSGSGGGGHAPSGGGGGGHSSGGGSSHSGGRR